MRVSGPEPGSSRPYRVVVAEDEPIIRENIMRKIDEAGCGFTVVASAGDGQSAFELLERDSPHLLVTDIRMPGLDGLQLISRAARDFPDVRIMIVSGYDDFEYARQAIKHGVRDYLLKPVDKVLLREALVRVRTELDAEREASRDVYARLRNARLPSEAASELERYLRHHFAERLDIREAARALNINYASVGRLFKRYYGMSPLKYLLALRTKRAKQLLIEEPDVDIRTISQMVGYEDQGYFTRVFRLNAGVSPTAFRRGNTGRGEAPGGPGQPPAAG